MALALLTFGEAGQHSEQHEQEANDGVVAPERPVAARAQAALSAVPARSSFSRRRPRWPVRCSAPPVRVTAGRQVTGGDDGGIRGRKVTGHGGWVGLRRSATGRGGRLRGKARLRGVDGAAEGGAGLALGPGAAVEGVSDGGATG